MPQMSLCHAAGWLAGWLSSPLSGESVILLGVPLLARSGERPRSPAPGIVSILYGSSQEEQEASKPGRSINPLGSTTHQSNSVGDLKIGRPVPSQQYG